ncbi:hypothetical protein GALMADRAFT_1086258 [Galerina marginata CBS 339.88]|uniref:Uncharacterized protein n=1 Tax=Galerina marginata (strain CBS 339.88) TaxID=685588 RepID=A0A067SBV0_GALM3|nr:hypothetical protein GALMADRAFT_1086258 [Galerina marginata CBS 339.88]
MQVKPLQFQAPPPSTYDLFIPDVSLIAEVISVDPISRTIVMNWYPKMTSENCSSNHSTAIDIYIPNTLLDMTSPSWTAQTVDQPAYRLNSTQICANVMQAYSSFRTITKLVASKEYLVLQVVEDQSSFQSYPFDVYLAPFAFYTRNQETGEVAALKISQAFGVAVNFKISLLNSFINIHGPGMEYLQIYLRVERSTATKIFVVVVAVMNWLTATVFLTICASTIVYSNPAIYSEMFVVPIGALFAFSSIRANLPGAPAGFGATIDMFTIVPVLVIMSACSFFLLLIVLYRRITADTRREKHGTVTNVWNLNNLAYQTSMVLLRIKVLLSRSLFFRQV